MDSHTTATLCRVCLRSCGILVQSSEKGVQIRGNPDHPVSRGFMCFRGAHYSEVHGSEHRIRTPLLRKKNHWIPLSYEDAVAILAEKFEQAGQRYGAQSIALLKGEALKHQEISGYFKHLAHAMGSPNYLSIGSMCQRALVMGHGLTYGGIPRLDFQRAGSVVLWGRNIAAASIQMFRDLKKALKRGMKLIVIDPSKTKTAGVADLHLPVTPGSDGFLALAFIKQAVEAYGLEPEPGREIGWDRLKNHVHGLSYGRLLEKTGITERLFLEASEMIFSHRPCWNHAGVGLELQPNGVQTIRAIACFQSLVDPGKFPTHMAYPFNPLPNQKGYPDMPDPVGYQQAPLFVNQGGEGQAMFLPRAVFDNDPYPVRAMLIAGANPLLTFPETATQKKMFAGLDFLAVCDLFMTETARAADLVLPATGFLGSLEIHDYGRVGKPYLGLVKPIKNPGPGWPVWKWIFELARHLGLKSFFPWDDNETALKDRLAGTPVCFADLEASPSATVSYDPESSMARGSGLPETVHYYSPAAEDAAGAGHLTAGAFELPFYTDKDYPFWLSTGDRVVYYQHSQFRMSQSCLKRMPGPVVDIHPDAAARLEISDKDKTCVSTRYGQLTVQARITDEVRPDCLRIIHGWEEANVNQLTGLEFFDPLSGFPWCRALPASCFRQMPVSVKK